MTTAPKKLDGVTLAALLQNGTSLTGAAWQVTAAGQLEAVLFAGR